SSILRGNGPAARCRRRNASTASVGHPQVWTSTPRAPVRTPSCARIAWPWRTARCHVPRTITTRIRLNDDARPAWRPVQGRRRAARLFPIAVATCTNPRSMSTRISQPTANQAAPITNSVIATLRSSLDLGRDVHVDGGDERRRLEGDDVAIDARLG